MKVYLIGLPGSGIKLLGKKVANSIKLPFIDLSSDLKGSDEVDVSLLPKKGEEQHRLREAEMLRMKSQDQEFIMAIRGATPCFHNNMQFINETGISIFINPSIESIAEKLVTSVNKRDDYFVGDTENLTQTYKRLLDDWYPFYRQAQHTLSGDNITSWDILQLLFVKK